MPAKKRLDHTGKLSRRERRVVELVAQGLKNREIATELGIGVFVVRNYLSAIYDKIGLSNRVELALWYWARKQEGSPSLAEKSSFGRVLKGRGFEPR